MAAAAAARTPASGSASAFSKSATLPMLNTGTFRSIRFMNPASTWPGPNSIMASAPAASRPGAKGFATRSETIAPHAMACTSQPLATQVALDILKQGGSAVDAAIAANAVLGLVEPTGNGIGGDLFAIVRDGVATPLRADTVLREGDKVIAIGRADCEALLHEQLIGALDESASA